LGKEGFSGSLSLREFFKKTPETPYASYALAERSD